MQVHTEEEAAANEGGWCCNVGRSIGYKHKFWGIRRYSVVQCGAVRACVKHIPSCTEESTVHE